MQSSNEGLLQKSRSVIASSPKRAWRSRFQAVFLDCFVAPLLAMTFLKWILVVV